jgi:hypothetical protein
MISEEKINTNENNDVVEDVITTNTNDNVSDKRTTGKYAILMETNDEEFEQWYYFIKVEGNEENLEYLHKQLKKIDWEIMEDLSAFELDMDYFVSAQTAKEMSKVSLNYYSDHRKFDGKLKKIDFDFRKKDGNETKICKVFDTVGYGKIEDYISDEDVDEEDLCSDSDSDSTDEESVSSSSSEEDNKKKTNKKLPSSVLREKIRDKILKEQDKRKKGSTHEKSNHDE